MTIDWKKKLTSRKFWTALANFAGMLILAFGGKQEVALQITEIIMAGAGVIAYIISEGLVDAANVGQGYYEPEEAEEDEEDEEDLNG